MTGMRAEDRAASWLKGNGFDIVERNFTTRFGEIDIIAEKNGVVYFVEVRSRRSTTSFGTVAEFVSKRKIHHLLTAGLTYLRSRQKVQNPYEFILVAVLWENKNRCKMKIIPIA